MLFLEEGCVDVRGRKDRCLLGSEWFHTVFQIESSSEFLPNELMVDDTNFMKWKWGFWKLSLWEKVEYYR
jgi:hypothetical protein